MSALRPTLLLVDDETSVLEVLSRVFEKRCEVVAVTSAKAALEILRTRSVELLLTDQKMPDMTGIELAAAARAEGIEVLTILMTAYTNPVDLIAAINQGQVYRYITKPWDVNDLNITVRNALELVALRREKDKLLEGLRKRVEALHVLHDVSRKSASDAPTLEAVVDHLQSAVGRVLDHDCSAVLVEAGAGQAASLRIRVNGLASERVLLHVKEHVLNAHRKAAGVLLPEEQVITHVVGNLSDDPKAPLSYPGALAVPLVAGQTVVGTLALFSSNPVAYTPEDGELLDLLVHHTTEVIRTLRAAELDQRLRIERMVESMADGVVLTNDKNEVLVINPTARVLLEVTDDHSRLGARFLEERLGFSPFEAVRGWEYGGHKVSREEIRLLGRTVHLTVSPVTEPKGALRGVVMVLRDVTEQKLLAERKEEFVSIVSHELRTPLTSITGALDLVLNFISGDINEKQRRYLEMARESTEKLNALVDDLLDLSKFASGKMRMNIQFTHLDEVIRRAAERLLPLVGDKRQTLQLELPQAAVRVLADSGRITQVLNNLLTNAIKFTPEGGEVRVTLSDTGAAPGFVSLTVWNSGDPIAEADLERIFDRFEQARSDRTRAVRGTGLGLSICRSIVEGHGGRVWAEPQGVGAQFVVVLPVEPSDEAVQAAEKPSAALLPRPTRGTVLVVEDQPDVAYVLKGALLSRGYAVHLASCGEEALLLARRKRPEVILLDVRLPDIDGLKLAEIFRHDPDTRLARLLMISGLDVRDRALRAGASAFLLKPLAMTELFSSVDGLMNENAAPRGRVLVIDDDRLIREVCAGTLANQGFAISQAASVAQAREEMKKSRPDLLLLDVLLPDGDGFSFFEELKAARASSPLPVIFISSRTETSAKVRALKLGGDDYLTKPFDAVELGARVESVLRRRFAEANASPTTQLPGSAAIEREVQARIKAKEPFAFCYLDLDNLKAYNDFYGFAKADGVVRQTGDLLREVFAQEGSATDFLGHVAGDDFVFVTALSTVDPVCRKIIEAFDRIIPLYYDKLDRERGHIEGDDRFGERRRFPIMSVSIVAVITDGSVDHAELARRAAELKKTAKAVVGSVYLRSDRPEPETGVGKSA